MVETRVVLNNLLDLLDREPDRFTEWQSTFLISLARHLRQGRTLTQKQENRLVEMDVEITGRKVSRIKVEAPLVRALRAEIAKLKNLNANQMALITELQERCAVLEEVATQAIAYGEKLESHTGISRV